MSQPSNPPLPDPTNPPHPIPTDQTPPTNQILPTPAIPTPPTNPPPTPLDNPIPLLNNPLPVNDFDLDPDFEGYHLLPVSDGRQPIYRSADGHVYSRRIEIDPIDKIKRHGFYCAMGRYFVTLNGQQESKAVCTGTPANPCEHVPTAHMHTLHRVIRAAKLICCDLLDKRRIPFDLRKGTVADILTEVFRAYDPDYPNLDVGQVFEHRSAGWKFIRVQKEAPRTPWAVVRDSVKPVLEEEMIRERARGPEFGQAHTALFEKFRVMPPDEEDEEPRPELVTLRNAARAWFAAEGLSPEDMTLRGRGIRGGLRTFKFDVPKE